MDSLTNGNASINGHSRRQEIKFESQDLWRNTVISLDSMRRNNKLCDIELQVDGKSLSAHRVVLAAISPYFYAMFNGEMSEKNKSAIVLHGVSFEALELLVDYFYTSSIVISEDNVQTLLPAASLFQISSVREACCRFLLKQLDPSNCLGIRQFADAHSCEELHQTSDKYIIENFPEVAMTEEFLLLPYTEVENLISSNVLNVSSEECVYDAVIRWVKHDIENRESKLGPLLNHVRLPLTSRNFLLTVSEEPLIQNNPEGKDLLIEAMKYHLSPESRSEMIGTRTASRKPDGLKTYIFVVGGGSLFEIHHECEYYNPITDRWSRFASTSQKKSRLGVTSVDRYVYAIGGYSDNHELSAGECYDPLRNQWFPISSMGTRRSCLGVTSLNGLIYAAGGYDGASCLSSAEQYDPLVGTWSSIRAMEVPRRNVRLTSLEGSLYALGGYDGTNYQATVERYDPREGRWCFMPPMTSRRSNCGTGVLNGKLYAVGGNEGTLCLNTVERFDVVSNKWEVAATMNSKRATHEVVSADGYLYAIGGNDGSTSLGTAERYEPEFDRWVVICGMLLRRSSVGATALKCPGIEKIIASTMPSSPESQTPPESKTPPESRSTNLPYQIHMNSVKDKFLR